METKLETNPNKLEARRVIVQYPPFFWQVQYPLINLTVDFTCFDLSRLCDFNELLVTSQVDNIKNQSQEKKKKKKKKMFLFSLSPSCVLSLFTSLLHSFNSTPSHCSWPIFTSSSYKSQVTILHTFSLNLSARFGFLNDVFNDLFQVKLRVGQVFSSSLQTLPSFHSFFLYQFNAAKLVAIKAKPTGLL